MKVWLIEHLDYGDKYIVSFETNILEHNLIKTELENIQDIYPEEHEEFILDINSIRTRGFGSATIEERVSVEIYEVN